MTPEGFYDATPGTDPYISWRIGEALLPAEASAWQFHRPEKIREALGAADAHWEVREYRTATDPTLRSARKTRASGS